MSEPVAIRVYALDQIGKRLDGVADAVQSTASSQAPDSIHDLRVSIRRFTQGLRLFPDFLPAGPVKRVRKALRRIMDVTSEVRNRDIALQELGEEGSKKLKKSLGEARERYAQEFVALVGELNAGGVIEQWRTELAVKVPAAKAAVNGRDTTLEHAKDVLPKLASKYFRAGRKLDADSPKPEDLHHFRVKTKQFRYALEIFHPVYREALEPRLAELKEVQDLLGKISDLYTTHGLLEGASAIRKRLSEAGEEKTKEFQSYWTGTFDAPGEKRAWKQVLRTPLAAEVAPSRKRGPRRAGSRAKSAA